MEEPKTRYVGDVAEFINQNVVFQLNNVVLLSTVHCTYIEWYRKELAWYRGKKERENNHEEVEEVIIRPLIENQRKFAGIFIRLVYQNPRFTYLESEPKIEESIYRNFRNDLALTDIRVTLIIAS